MARARTADSDDEIARRATVAERALGITFKDRSLLTQALTHPSFSNRQADALVYERLEFLGDSVLGLVVADFIYSHYPEADEGALAELRAALVSGRTLATLAEHLGLGEAILMDGGVEAAGGRRLASVLADCFEAVIAAVYLDRGIQAARDLVLRVYETRLDPDVLLGSARDFKSQLQERLQAGGGPTPTYRTIAETGPAHDRTFTVEVLTNGVVAGRGTGRSKKDAEREAAGDALERLG